MVNLLYVEDVSLIVEDRSSIWDNWKKGKWTLQMRQRDNSVIGDHASSLFLVSSREHVLITLISENEPSNWDFLFMYLLWYSQLSNFPKRCFMMVKVCPRSRNENKIKKMFNKKLERDRKLNHNLNWVIWHYFVIIISLSQFRSRHPCLEGPMWCAPHFVIRTINLFAENKNYSKKVEQKLA